MMKNLITLIFSLFVSFHSLAEFKPDLFKGFLAYMKKDYEFEFLRLLYNHNYHHDDRNTDECPALAALGQGTTCGGMFFWCGEEVPLFKVAV